MRINRVQIRNGLSMLQFMGALGPRKNATPHWQRRVGGGICLCGVWPLRSRFDLGSHDRRRYL